LLGTYVIRDESNRELSEANSLDGARYNVRIHLVEDAEEPPLTIVAPDGFEVEQGTLDSCGHVVFRGSSLSRRYEEVTEVIGRWGRPEKQ
jgi:hypothetical protein